MQQRNQPAHIRIRSASDSTTNFSVGSPYKGHGQEFSIESAAPTLVYDEPASVEVDMHRAFVRPNPALPPHFGRRQITLIALSGVIGTGLFLGSGTALYDAGPVGLLMGYSAWSIVVYGFIVSATEMVTVFPYCHGTVGLANVFVDPALGFAMGWNAWYHWGITIPSQIESAMALLKYWQPAARLAPLWPFLFITFSCGSVLGARRYGEVESVTAIIKVSAILLISLMGIIFDFTPSTQDTNLPGAKMSKNPFKYWDTPFQQYLGISGHSGQFLGFIAVFMQAAFSFFGTEIPCLLAGEMTDAPRVLPQVTRRVWIRVTFLYLLGIFMAGALVPAAALGSRDLSLPGSPEDDAPWDTSSFLVALNKAGKKYNVLTNIFVACIITSAASAASTEVFISSRYLVFLSQAGHAPKIFGWVSPKDPKKRQAGQAVPVIGVLMTMAFATLSFMSMRPGPNTMGGAEKVFRWISSMVSAACLQAWIGVLFTYLRFYQGTRDPRCKAKYGKEIARIEENRAWGQPYWAMLSFIVCILVLIFNGWSSFRTGVWVIYHSPDKDSFTKDQVVKFVTTYLPIPVLLLLVFGYKLINQTTMVSIADMDFSGVQYPGEKPVQRKPTGFWGRVWWFLVY